MKECCYQCNRIRRKMCQEHERTCALYNYFASLVWIVGVFIFICGGTLLFAARNKLSTKHFTNETEIKLEIRGEIK